MLFPKNDFNKISCKEAYVDKHHLMDMFEHIDKEKINIHQMILLQDGSKVFDAYAKGHEDKKENVYSVSKSFTSIAIGILIDQGVLSLEDYVLFYFANDLKKYKDGYEKLKLKHLLTMTVGQASDRYYGLSDQHDPIEIFFNTPLKHEPGTVFYYSNFTTLMLSIIVTKVTGQTLNAFLDKKLYQKIGLNDIEWPEYAGYSLGCTGLRLSVKDMARFGLLLLNEGSWNGEQIVSKKYIKAATSMQMKTTNQDNPDDQEGYGYQFWMNDCGDYKAVGLYNQLIIINQKFNLVFACIAYEERRLSRLFCDYILKGFESGYKTTYLSLKDAIKVFYNHSEQRLEEEKKVRKY